MAAARARASLDPPSGQESASLLAMRNALDAVMDELTDHSHTTTSCFLNVWRRIVRALDDMLMAEMEKEGVSDEDVSEHDTSKHSDKKKSIRNTKNKRK